MYVSSYLERLKLKLAALPLEGTLHVENGGEVLNAWGDMDLGERQDSYKPVGRWLRLSIMPYEEFCVWCWQHGIHAYFHEDGTEMVFVRVQIDVLRLDKLMQEIPSLYARAGKQPSTITIMKSLVSQSIDLLRTARQGGTAKGLARLFIGIVQLCYGLKIDLATEVFSEMVSEKLSQIEGPDEVAAEAPLISMRKENGLP